MKQCIVLVYIVLILVGCSNKTGSTGGQSKESWPVFRADAGLSGYTSIPLPDKPVLKWVYTSDSRTSSSPVIDQGVVYWCDKRGKVYGVDREGGLCFSYDFQTAVEAIPMVVDSVLYIGRIDGFMSALSIQTQDTLWNFETQGQIAASPNTLIIKKEQILVFGSYDHRLYCLDSRTGKEISHIESGYYINGAAALCEDYLIFGGCDSWLKVVHIPSGVTTDSLQLEAYVPQSPAIRDNTCYVVDYSGTIYEIHLEKGKITRSGKIIESIDENAAFLSIPAVSDKYVYYLSDDKHLYAVHRKERSVQWKFLQKGDSGPSSPVICDNKVICCTKTGIISILDSKTGELLWEYDTGESITASPAVIKDAFYILTNKGRLFCFGR